MPRISVIVPAYNAAAFLAETLDSVLSQTYKDWECVICNDGSTDATEQVAAGFCAADRRFKLVSQKNAGLPAARNKAISFACGEFVLPLDADDKIGQDYMRLALEQFDREPETKLVYCEAEFFGAFTGKWRLPEYRYERLIACNCIFCSCVYRKADAVAVGLYDESFRKGYEDWDFLLRFLRPEDKVVRLPQVMFFYRQHEGGSMITSTITREVELLPMLADRYPSIYDDYRRNVIKYMRGYVEWEDCQKARAARHERKKHWLRHLLRFLSGAGSKA